MLHMEHFASLFCVQNKLVIGVTVKTPTFPTRAPGVEFLLWLSVPVFCQYKPGEAVVMV